MSIVSSGALIDVLRQHGLLNSEQLARLSTIVHGRCGHARDLARLLVQHGWLTIYQINQLLAGKARQLVYGPYHVLDALGAGGLSQVFKARHSQHSWVVALKILKPEAIASPEGKTQFLREMEAMARLDHPNIVQFCDVDQSDDTFYFAMEFVDGTDLGKYVRLGGPLPLTEACQYIYQAAMALQHAYERNLVHRDIKPVNLFLTHVTLPRQFVSTRTGKPVTKLVKQPVIKILDWGLAELRAPRGQTQAQLMQNIVSGIIGTADYMSPEQAQRAHEVDTRSDIYSLGCTFYYLLTGRPPFPEGTLAQKLFQHQQAEPQPLHAFRADVPPGVQEIVSRMLAKQPEARFQTPAAVALALLPYLRGNQQLYSLTRDQLARLRGIQFCSSRAETPLSASTATEYQIPPAPRTDPSALADTPRVF